MNTLSVNLRAALVSCLILVFFLGAWQLSSQGPAIGAATKAGASAEEIEYLKMMGKDPGASKSTGFPPPIEVAKATLKQLSNPFYDNGPNDKGIGIQLVDNNLSGVSITNATVTAKVYNSGGTLVDTYSCTVTYGADGRATFVIDTTVTDTPGTYTATITRTTGASDTQIFGPLRIYVRDI